eukprot:15009982-Alexandrium_andersonii.AAC.1
MCRVTLLCSSTESSLRLMRMPSTSSSPSSLLRPFWMNVRADAAKERTARAQATKSQPGTSTTSA